MCRTRRSMELLRQDIMVSSNTQSKKRKIEAAAQNPSYAGAAAVNGVQPLGTPQQRGVKLPKSTLKVG